MWSLLSFLFGNEGSLASQQWHEVLGTYDAHFPPDDTDVVAPPLLARMRKLAAPGDGNADGGGAADLAGGEAQQRLRLFIIEQKRSIFHASVMADLSLWMKPRGVDGEQLGAPSVLRPLVETILQRLWYLVRQHDQGDPDSPPTPFQFVCAEMRSWLLRLASLPLTEPSLRSQVNKRRKLLQTLFALSCFKAEGEAGGGGARATVNENSVFRLLHSRLGKLRRRLDDLCSQVTVRENLQRTALDLRTLLLHSSEWLYLALKNPSDRRTGDYVDPREYRVGSLMQLPHKATHAGALALALFDSPAFHRVFPHAQRPQQGGDPVDTRARDKASGYFYATSAFDLHKPGKYYVRWSWYNPKTKKETHDGAYASDTSQYTQSPRWLDRPVPFAWMTNNNLRVRLCKYGDSDIVDEIDVLAAQLASKASRQFFMVDISTGGSLCFSVRAPAWAADEAPDADVPDAAVPDTAVSDAADPDSSNGDVGDHGDNDAVPVHSVFPAQPHDGADEDTTIPEPISLSFTAVRVQGDAYLGGDKKRMLFFKCIWAGTDLEHKTGFAGTEDYTWAEVAGKLPWVPSGWLLVELWKRNNSVFSLAEVKCLGKVRFHASELAQMLASGSGRLEYDLELEKMAGVKAAFLLESELPEVDDDVLMGDEVGDKVDEEVGDEGGDEDLVDDEVDEEKVDSSDDEDDVDVGGNDLDVDEVEQVALGAHESGSSIGWVHPVKVVDESGQPATFDLGDYFCTFQLVTGDEARVYEFGRLRSTQTLNWAVSGGAGAPGCAIKWPAVDDEHAIPSPNLAVSLHRENDGELMRAELRHSALVQGSTHDIVFRAADDRRLVFRLVIFHPIWLEGAATLMSVTNHSPEGHLFKRERKLVQGLVEEKKRQSDVLFENPFAVQAPGDKTAQLQVPACVRRLFEKSPVSSVDDFFQHAVSGLAPAFIYPQEDRLLELVIKPVYELHASVYNVATFYLVLEQAIVVASLGGDLALLGKANKTLRAVLEAGEQLLGERVQRTLLAVTEVIQQHAAEIVSAEKVDRASKMTQWAEESVPRLVELQSSIHKRAGAVILSIRNTIGELEKASKQHNLKLQVRHHLAAFIDLAHNFNARLTESGLSTATALPDRLSGIKYSPVPFADPADVLTGECEARINENCVRVAVGVRMLNPKEWLRFINSKTKPSRMGAGSPPHFSHVDPDPEQLAAGSTSGDFEPNQYEPLYRYDEALSLPRGHMWAPDKLLWVTSSTWRSSDSWQNAADDTDSWQAVDKHRFVRRQWTRKAFVLPQRVVHIDSFWRYVEQCHARPVEPTSTASLLFGGYRILWAKLMVSPKQSASAVLDVYAAIAASLNKNAFTVELDCSAIVKKHFPYQWQVGSITGYAYKKYLSVGIMRVDGDEVRVFRMSAKSNKQHKIKLKLNNDKRQQQLQGTLPPEISPTWRFGNVFKIISATWGAAKTVTDITVELRQLVDDHYCSRVRLAPALQFRGVHIPDVSRALYILYAFKNRLRVLNVPERIFGEHGDVELNFAGCLAGPIEHDKPQYLEMP